MLSPSASTIVFRVLFCALLATSVGQSVMLTTLPSMGRQANLSEFHIATIMSSSALIFAFGTNVWSKVAKRAGFKRILMVGLSGYSLGTFAFASAWMAGFSGIISGTNLFLALLISRSLQSTIMSATPPSAVGYAVAISSPQSRVSAISKVTSASNVGQIVGPAYAGLLVSFGLLAPLYSIVLLTLLALTLVYFKLPVLPPLSQQKNAQQTSDNNQAPSKVPYVFVAACICVFCAMAMMQQSLGFFFIDFYDYSPVDAARQVGFAMMVSAGTKRPNKQRSDDHYRASAIGLSLLAALSSTFVIYALCGHDINGFRYGNGLPIFGSCSNDLLRPLSTSHNHWVNYSNDCHGLCNRSATGSFHLPTGHRATVRYRVSANRSNHMRRLHNIAKNKTRWLGPVNRCYTFGPIRHQS